MKNPLLILIRIFVRVIAKTNSSLPLILELDLKHMQGKGTGAANVQKEAELAINFLTRRGIKNPVVLDVGANVGDYSDAFLKINPEAAIFAFEPSVVSRRELENRFLGNNHVTIFPYALGNDVSTKTLWSDIAGSGHASLTKRRLDHFGINFNYSEQVAVTTLDAWRRTTRVKPDIIKMDVEGHELDVLRGGLETLSLTQVLQFEFGGCNIDTRTFFQDFWYLLTPMGFKIYRISDTGTVYIPQYSEEDEYFSTTNYLAVRE